MYDCYKRLLKKAGLDSNIRIHDLRASYTLLALRNNDDIKTIQTTLGHATPEFTMSVYAYITDQEQKESAKRMGSTMRALSV